MTVTTRDSEISIVAHACTMFLLSPGVLLVGAIGLLEAGVLLGEDLHLHDHLVVELNHCLVQPGHSDDDNDNDSDNDNDNDNLDSLTVIIFQ